MKERRNAGWKITAKDCYVLLERQEHKCALSGLALTPNTVEIMHIVPIESEGQHALDNVALVDSTIYKLARGLTPYQLAAICAQVLDNLCGKNSLKTAKAKLHINPRHWRILLSSQTNNFNKSVERLRRIDKKSRKKYYHSWGEILSQKVSYFEKRLK